MVRIAAIAETSFAAIGARRRKLGIAIAARISTIGIPAIQRYPSTSPAMAIPSPFNRPALLRISDSPRCPKTIAATKAGGAKNNSPQTRLMTALELVSASPREVAPVGVVGLAGIALSCRPQARQNLSSGSTRFPQVAQICVIPVSRDATLRR